MTKAEDLTVSEKHKSLCFPEIHSVWLSLGLSRDCNGFESPGYLSRCDQADHLSGRTDGRTDGAATSQRTCHSKGYLSGSWIWGAREVLGKGQGQQLFIIRGRDTSHIGATGKVIIDFCQPDYGSRLHTRAPRLSESDPHHQPGVTSVEWLG